MVKRTHLQMCSFNILYNVGLVRYDLYSAGFNNPSYLEKFDVHCIIDKNIKT